MIRRMRGCRSWRSLRGMHPCIDGSSWVWALRSAGNGWIRMFEMDLCWSWTRQSGSRDRAGQYNAIMPLFIVCCHAGESSCSAWKLGSPISECMVLERSRQSPDAYWRYFFIFYFILIHYFNYFNHFFSIGCFFFDFRFSIFSIFIFRPTLPHFGKGTMLNNWSEWIQLSLNSEPLPF